MLYTNQTEYISIYIYIYIFFNIYPQDASECGDDPIIEVLLDLIMEYEREDEEEEEEQEQN